MLIRSAVLSSTTSSRRRRGCAKSLILVERVRDAFRRRRLDDEGERAARQPVLAILVERDDLHRDVARQRILLELAEHVPAQHVGQEHVERDRGRLILLGQIERVFAAHRQQHLEALVAGEIDQDARIVRIVLDDQQQRIAGLDIQPVVRDLLDRALGRGRQQTRSAERIGSGASSAGRTAPDGPTYFSGR